MSKKAYLVDFCVRTRVVIDDEGLTKDEFIAKLAELGRKNILKEPEGYLCGDNMVEYEDDEECPFGTFDDDRREMPWDYGKHFD